MTMPAIKIAPSLLAADLARAGEQVLAVHEAGADVLHVDVADGHFAPNLTFGPAIVAALRHVSSIHIATHLMVTNPEQFIKPFVEAGSNEVFFHIELDLDHAALARTVRELGAQPGIAVEVNTPAERLERVVGHVDAILVMTVRCGYTGQKFMPSAARKIPALRRMFGDGIDIAVDGGVVVENAGALAAAGANVFIAGKSIFWAIDHGKAIRDLRAAAGAGAKRRKPS